MTCERRDRRLGLSLRTAALPPRSALFILVHNRRVCDSTLPLGPLAVRGEFRCRLRPPASLSCEYCVNGDGFADLIVGALRPTRTGNASGASYVVFGKASGFAANLDLSSLDGTTGFKLSGAAADDSGYSVASAGDVNGDGFADLIVGASGAARTATVPAASYVVFGKASGFAANLDLSTLDGTTGFKLSGVAADDFSGFSVASAGDVNGDGFADLIVGAPRGRSARRRFRRELRGVRQGLGLCRQPRSLDASTAATASSSAAAAGRLRRRLLGRLGRRRQRRRLRRPDRRGLATPTRNGRPFRRELRGVRQGRGLCRQSLDLSTPRRRDRLQAQRRGGGDGAALGGLGGRRQRRRLRRRPDRRRLRGRSARQQVRARATWCSARPRALPPTSTSRAARRHHRLQAQRRGGGRLRAAARSPRPATSTATASPT